MTGHDEARRNRALRHCGNVVRESFTNKLQEVESLIDAVVGLQSTDDPSLVWLWDEMSDRLSAMFIPLKGLESGTWFFMRDRKIGVMVEHDTETINGYGNRCLVLKNSICLEFGVFEDDETVIPLGNDCRCFLAGGGTHDS